jgi:transposase-like protein
LEEIFNQVLLDQSTEQLGTAPYERTEGRTAYRNGTRERQLTTRVGTLTLKVPRHRNGQFSTELFMRYQRSEQALMLAMLEMVINGVSTRKIESVTRLMGALLMEQDEKWQTGRKYFDMELYYQTVGSNDSEEGTAALIAFPG